MTAFGAVSEDNLPHYLKEAATCLHVALSLFSSVEVPFIIGVNGIAAGAGMSLACNGDIVLAAESARFVMAYTTAGLTPDGGATYFLPRIVGLKKALELVLTNKELSAKEAMELGIVNRIVPDADLPAELDKMALQLASGATKALCAAKRLLYSGWNNALETQMEMEAQSIADMGRTSDAREAIKAFIEKRKVLFHGE